MAGLITEFLGQGAVADRPATPDIPAGAIAFWYATDTNELSRWAEGAWAAVGSGGVEDLDDLTDVDLTGAADGDVLTRSGGVWVSETPAAGGSTFRGALVKKSLDQTNADYTTAPAVAWDDEEYDTDGFHDSASNNTRLTIPAGVSRVRLSYCVRIASGTADTFITAVTSKNGSSVFTGTSRIYVDASTSSPAISGVSAILSVVPGDYFELLFQQQADTSITITASLSWFQIEVIE